MKLRSCLACNSQNITPVLDLGEQPLANAFYSRPTNESAEVFPLKINHCLDCTHSQLDETVNPKKLFSDYKYVSGTTETLKKHFEQLVYDCIVNHDGARQSVLDIAANDGTLLTYFKKKGYLIDGVDPANNLRPLSKERGIPVLVDFWDSKTALKMRKSSYDIITVLNCLGHVPDPYDFLLGCTRVLSPAGVVIIEVPYLLSTLQSKDLGQFYHEHCSYFTVQSMMNLVERVNLHIAEIEEFPNIHGGTLRFVLRRGNGPHCSKSRVYISDQEMMSDFPKLFAELINEQDLIHLFSVVASKNSSLDPVIAYGASAKSTVLFNLPYLKEHNFTNHIQFVADDAPLKQGNFCPGTHLKVHSPDILYQYSPNWEGFYPTLNILLTVHNFKAEVVKRLKALNLPNKVRIINYTPFLKIENLEDL